MRKTITKQIYVLGNEYIEGDGFAREIAAEINKQHHIVNVSSPDIFLEYEGEHLIILDVVKNITTPLKINDVSMLSTRKIMTLHDFDLGYVLKMMQAIGKKVNITIIGVPPKGNKHTIVMQVQKLIEECD